MSDFGYLVKVEEEGTPGWKRCNAGREERRGWPPSNGHGEPHLKIAGIIVDNYQWRHEHESHQSDIPEPTLEIGLLGQR